ncbi:MAG: type III pantothenate kinase [Veillonellaceae bacterium]|nr:type III pantothenate kinase [Veillonellaceae bacterium]
MLLVIDVGNTNIVLGLYEGRELKDFWRISTDRLRSTDEYGVLFSNLFHLNNVAMEDVEAIIVSSVVPPLNPTLERMAHRYFKVEPMFVGPGTKTGMNIKYENPREVGADRIVNAVAAYERFGGPLIVIDFGTATTFCAIDENGDYLGGAIAPGVGISVEALFQRAAKLPRIELKKVDSVICKNTIASMQAGVFYGYVGQVDGIVGRMKEELGADAAVIATGGLAALIAAESQTIDYVAPMLTMEGLSILYERNK